MPNIGIEIRARRQELGLKVYELANKVGVHPVYITKIEKHNRLPTPAVFKRICEVLKLPKKFYDLYFNDKYGEETKPSVLTTDAIDNRPTSREPRRVASDKGYPAPFPRLPHVLAKDFQSPQEEQLVRYVLQQVTSRNMPAKEKYDTLIKEVAPDKAADFSLFSKVHDILLEMKKDQDMYWQGFLTKSKRIESLVLPPDQPQA